MISSSSGRGSAACYQSQSSLQFFGSKWSLVAIHVHRIWVCSPGILSYSIALLFQVCMRDSASSHKGHRSEPSQKNTGLSVFCRAYSKSPAPARTRTALLLAATTPQLLHPSCAALIPNPHLKRKAHGIYLLSACHENG